MNRRLFIQQSAVGAGLALTSQPIWAGSAPDFPVVRVAAAKRNFTSSAVEQTIERMHKTIRDPELAWLFENCFPNTLDTTVQFTTRNGQARYVCHYGRYRRHVAARQYGAGLALFATD